MDLATNPNYQRAVILRNLKEDEFKDVKGVLNLIEKLNESTISLENSLNDRDVTIKELRARIKRTETEITNSLLASLTVEAEKSFKVAYADLEANCKAKEELHKIQLSVSEINRNVAQDKVNTLEYALEVANHKIEQLTAEVEALKPKPQAVTEPDQPVIPTL
jgi:hypothetical protein